MSGYALHSHLDSFLQEQTQQRTSKVQTYLNNRSGTATETKDTSAYLVFLVTIPFTIVDNIEESRLASRLEPFFAVLIEFC